MRFLIYNELKTKNLGCVFDLSNFSGLLYPIDLSQLTKKEYLLKKVESAVRLHMQDKQLNKRIKGINYLKTDANNFWYFFKIDLDEGSALSACLPNNEFLTPLVDDSDCAVNVHK